MATKDQVEKLKNLFEKITELEIDELIYDKNWGSINFETAKVDLERLYALCNHLIVLPIEQLPSDIATQILTEATPIDQTISNIRGFTIEQSNPSGIRDQYVNEVKQNVDRFYKCAHIYVPYLAYQKGEIQNNIRQLTNSVNEARELLASAEEDANNRRLEINKIIQAAREATASVGVAHFTADFIAESEHLEKQALIWLWVTALLAALSLLTSTYFLFAHVDLSTTANAIQYVSSKILILVLLITATLWCGNLYKAAKHQAAANKFKGNSLKTFQAFVSATEDDAVRDAILVETTRAIFNESATGYLGSDGSGTEKSTKIVEIVKNGTQVLSPGNNS